MNTMLNTFLNALRTRAATAGSAAMDSMLQLTAEYITDFCATLAPAVTNVRLDTVLLRAQADTVSERLVAFFLDYIAVHAAPVTNIATEVNKVLSKMNQSELAAFIDGFYNAKQTLNEAGHSREAAAALIEAMDKAVHARMSCSVWSMSPATVSLAREIAQSMASGLPFGITTDAATVAAASELKLTGLVTKIQAVSADRALLTVDAEVFKLFAPALELSLPVEAAEAPAAEALPDAQPAPVEQALDETVETEVVETETETVDPVKVAPVETKDPEIIKAEAAAAGDPMPEAPARKRGRPNADEKAQYEAAVEQYKAELAAWNVRHGLNENASGKRRVGRPSRKTEKAVAEVQARAQAAADTSAVTPLESLVVEHNDEPADMNRLDHAVLVAVQNYGIKTNAAAI